MLCYRFLFTEDFRTLLKPYNINKEEISATFDIIWYNAKKLGLVFVGAYAITKFSMFLAGLYLSNEEIASYGLMMQLVNILSAVATTFFITFQPKFAALRVEGDQQGFVRLFSFSMVIFYVLFALGGCILLFGGNTALSYIQSNAFLPSKFILCLYIVVVLLENNHSHFATAIISKNNIPFVKPALIAGAGIVIGSFIVLKYTSWGILGLVFVQGFCQAVYNNWKWPLVILREFKITMFQLVHIGVRETYYKLKRIFK
jgi:polysaccharide biosynthesis protein